MATDPVCGMTVDEKTTKYSSLYIKEKMFIFVEKLARIVLIVIHQNMDISESFWLNRK